MTVKAINQFGENWRWNTEESLYLRVDEGEIGGGGNGMGRETGKERKRQMWKRSVLEVRGSRAIQVQQCQMDYLGQGYFIFLYLSLTKSK